MKMKLFSAMMILSLLVGECSGATAFAAEVNNPQSEDMIEIADEDELSEDESSEDETAEIVDEESLLDEGYEESDKDLLEEEWEYKEISSADELLALSVSLNSISGGKYILTQDIDMTGKDWIMPKYNPKEFDGDGHTISNLSISFSEPPTRTGRYRCYGMFNNTSVKNLTLNNTTVNCNFYTFDNICAAMTGSGSAVNCILKGCTKFLSPSPETEITYVGGIVGMATYNVDQCILKGEIDCSDITYITSVAGIIGYVLAKNGEGGTGTFVRKCKTEEGSFIKINDSANSYVSGIAGCSETSSPDTFAFANFHDCENNASTNGPVFSGITYGGVDGGCAGLNLMNCVNKANITLKKMEWPSASCGAGIIHSSNGYILLYNCVNLGNITAQYAYGIMANLGKSNPLPTDRIFVEMTSCANKGNITADSIAAGLAGKSYNAIIRESYNTGDICADSAAGLVEYLSSRNDYSANETEIRRCYNSGSVRGKNYAAGIVARIEPDLNDADVDISDCFNCGVIHCYPDGNANLSGIVANPGYRKPNQKITITRCYNAGAVAPLKNGADSDGNQIVGSLLIDSDVEGSTFTETDCFYYNDLNARAMSRSEECDRLSSCIISEEAKSDDELKNIFTDNSETWGHGKAGYPYPYLIRVGKDDLPTDYNHDREVSILKDLEYIKISSADELLALSVSLNSISGGKYKLTNDIDMTGKDWTMPLNNPEEFDGNGHTISNLCIRFSETPSKTDMYYCYGMFNNTSVKNLTLNNTTVNCNFDGSFNICAAMTGSGSAENCILEGSTKFSAPTSEVTYVGGIVGMATDDVTDCILKGEIDCSDITYITGVAGIIGRVLAKEDDDGTFVSGCKTEEGSFIKTKDDAGCEVSGIAACSETSSFEIFAYVNFCDCENNAGTNGPVFSGITQGVYGGSVGLKLTNCVNKANITLKELEWPYESSGVGIIHSTNGYIELTDCVNLGNITAQNAYGIIANLGSSNPGDADKNVVTMTRCANKGNITADNIAAGLVGRAYNAEIAESYNTGNICGGGGAAGLVWVLDTTNRSDAGIKTVISKCYNSGSVCGKVCVAGIVVYISPSYANSVVDISDCFNSGIIYHYPDSDPDIISGIAADLGYRKPNQKINFIRCYNAGAVAPLKDGTDYDGNQIAGYLLINSGVDGSTFKETDCFYYNDLNAKAMLRKEACDGLSSCVLSEVAKSGDELKNIYTDNSDIWGHGKAGYPYPYLIGVGEDDLPTDFDHDRDVSRLGELINYVPDINDAGEEPVITESTVTVKLATKQNITIAELKKEASDGKNYKITYEKSDGNKADSQYASLSNKGVISAKKEGTAKINLVKGDKNIEITVNVVNPKFVYENPKFKKFTTNTEESSVPKYESINMKTRFELDKTSVRKGLAEIDENTGEVTAKKKGTVTVTAIVGENTSASVRKVSTKVAIYDPVIYTKKSTVAVGKTLPLKIKNGAKTTEWSVSENGIATIDAKGRLHAISCGTTTVFAKNNGREMSIEITVVEK